MQLTLTERQILSLLCEGRTQLEIADELFMSLKNIEKYLDKLRTQHECKNSLQLIAKFKDIGKAA
jgi:DNA-binding CsgD family transcriptional regulator